jgi:hypothetical protein
LLEQRLQIGQSLVDVVERTLAQPMIFWAIMPVVYIATRFSQQLHRRVDRPSGIASALRRRRAPGVFSIVCRGNLDVVDGSIDLVNGMMPGVLALVPAVHLKVSASRAQVRECVKVCGELGVRLRSGRQKQKRQQR